MIYGFPEISTPKTQLRIYQFDCVSSTHQQKLNAIISKHKFYNKIHVITNSGQDTTESLNDCMRHTADRCHGLSVPDFNFCTLLEPSMLDRMRTHVLLGRSVSTNVDLDDTALVYDGHLELMLTKATYERFGLDGSRYGDKRLVRIDMADSKFLPGQGRFERVRTCLQRLPPLDMVLVARKNGQALSTVAANEIASELSMMTHERIRVPLFDFELLSAGLGDLKNGLTPFLVEVHEYLGMITTGCTDLLRIGSETDHFVSTYQVLEPNTLGTLHHWHLTSDLIPNDIAFSLLEQSMNATAASGWTAIHLEGHGHGTTVIVVQNKLLVLEWQ